MVLPPPVEVPTAKVHLDPDNFRKCYELESLQASIQRYGILQPPGLWADAARDCYFAIWGNRRVLCAQKLGLKTIWARVFPGPLEDGQADIYQLIENLQRADLKPSEEAAGYKCLMERQGLNASKLASLLNVSNGTVTKKLALLKLTPALLARVDSRELPETSGYELAALSPELQTHLAEQVKGPITRKQVRTMLGKPETPVTEDKQRSHAIRLASYPLSVHRGVTLAELSRALDELKPELQKADRLGMSVTEFAKSLRRPSSG
ncbi:ParB/RepB/Spo0J family partition protein [Paludisphaera sp.]|uniref:ParB/RepB/Spo0J family partition protein n=1 Tax=Paludisphaera sp. TaxID=2017432 RepID=UPI00301BD9C5